MDNFDLAHAILELLSAEAMGEYTEDDIVSISDWVEDADTEGKSVEQLAREYEMQA